MAERNPSLPNGFEEKLYNPKTTTSKKREVEHLEVKNLILSASYP